MMNYTAYTPIAAFDRPHSNSNSVYCSQHRKPKRMPSRDGKRAILVSNHDVCSSEPGFTALHSNERITNYGIGNVYMYIPSVELDILLATALQSSVWLRI
jgi:hypothetical protein